jgi:hypothetical protein
MVRRLCATALLPLALLVQQAAASCSYPIVGTGQTTCYDNRQEISAPKPGQPFYGQDAQHPGKKPSYKPSADGLTVYDNVTGLTWQRSPNLTGKTPGHPDKLTFAQAKQQPAKLNAVRFGGFNDWRLPTIKELYSLILFSGVDSGPNAGPSDMKPFIDTNYFKFAYGDEIFGERTIDSQWATCSTYVANKNKMFGLNFADGRIKGYGLTMPGRGDKKFYVLCCRGNPKYGQNDFRSNGDGTITDLATGLVWQKKDSGKGMNWEQALAYAAKAGNGWRLPNAKELQSILDYTRSPDATGSAAINPMFQCTAITNEIGKVDYPFYWSATTHANIRGGAAAVYVAFGRAAGWMPSHPGSSDRRFMDVHGAGAQRSDPKAGDPANFPQGRGPQGDTIHIYNFVRLVRDSALK